jgi:hypothetical protein
MGKLTNRWLAIGAAVALSFAVIACAGVPSESVEGTGNSGAALDAGEHASEGAGEHDEGGEGRGSEGVGEHNKGGEGEGSEGAGEHREGGEGEGSGEHGETGERLGSEEAGEHGVSEGGEEGEGEHGEEGGHEEGEEGEESGTYIARNETWDRTRRGARLILTFNASRNAFVGTVENTTEQTLCAVRVEVHLDSATELGPTARTDVPSGGTIEVELATEGEGFVTWTAHPELSPCGSGS